MKGEKKNWRLERDGDKIAWLHFDMADAGANVLSKDVLEELDKILNGLAKEPPRGLIILSDKPGGFIAGADINEFTKLEGAQDAEELIQRGQAVFDLLESLPFPTVSLIHGFCLGGGLELALACRYRVAEEASTTRLGLPEVQLGIHPGFGGTVRLPPLVGSVAAMDLMLTGKTVDVWKAKKMGLVDFAVPSRHLKVQAAQCILAPPPASPVPWKKHLENHSLARPLLRRFFQRQVEQKAPIEHYPAPHAVIDLWAKYAHRPKTMMKEEARSVARLITGTTARNLVRVFFLRERLKSLGRAKDFNGSHVHVVGGGIMGGDIAAWCALSGFRVTLQDREAKFLENAMKRAHQLFQKRLRPSRLARDAMDRLMPDIRGYGVSEADVVIEAIFEDVKVKQALFREIEPQLKDGAILATNTSSIPLEEMGQALSRPSRLVGIHFFNPVAKMPLVEIVAGAATGEEELKRASAFVRRIDRLPLPVKSAPGFLVNRVLMPYLMEAVTLVEEGTAPEVIDRAATDFGMPMGPILLADTVGLDICLHVGNILSGSLKGTVPKRLRELVESGRLGVKSGQGFYNHALKKTWFPKKKTVGAPSKDMADCLLLRIFNEAVACLREGVVGDADLLDAGVIFGTGFAPFRGGPLQHCRSVGISAIQKRLEELESRYGERFHPDPGWENLS